MNPSIDRLKLTQFGNIELLAKQVVEGFITGLHKSPFHGFSVEFAEHRIYNKGESTRHIDWKLYGRSEKLFTKKYEEETNLRCQILIDTSSSMYFPKDSEQNKIHFSVYAAASLIELLRRQRDAVGLTLFNEKIQIQTPAKSSPAHHRYLYSEMEKALQSYSTEKKSNTDIIQTLHDIAEIVHQRSLVILFSDLFDDPARLPELMQALQHLRHNKHEVIVFHVIDKELEENFELENRPYQLIDMETGESVRLQPSEIKDQYQKKITAYFDQIKKECANYRIDFVKADIQQGVNSVLTEYMIKRSKLF
ncbi:MAG: DUF58 domain-containing protein [Bacteroidota bacterium]